MKTLIFHQQKGFKNNSDKLLEPNRNEKQKANTNYVEND